MLLIRLIRLVGATGVPRLIFRLLLDSRVPLTLKLVWPAALLYIVSPIDLVPDILTPFGRIDDILALVVAAAIFIRRAPRHVVDEHMHAVRGGRGSARGRGASDSDKPVIEGSYHFVDDTEESSR